MTREEKKDAANVWVFEQFARHAAAQGLRVRPGSVESRRPREPDILCHVEGVGQVAFELVEIVDSDLREEQSVATREDRAATAVWTGDATMDQIRRKLEKTYATSHPVELVAWANPMLTPPSIWLPSHEGDLRALRGVSTFARIWFVNLGGPEVERGVWFVDPALV